ncbi:MAG: 3-deoxy-7-phosphoheptulonate synthase [Planctomycetota bacterium]
MLVIMRSDCTVEQLSEAEDAIRRLGFTPLPVPGANRTAICITGNKGPLDGGQFSRLPGVLECIRVTRSYKMVSREVHPEDTVVTVGGVKIGGAEPVVVAGPCSVETEARTLEVAAAVKRAGAKMFRAGAFKPRTSPYSFPGLGEEALLTLKRVREEIGLPVISEVLDTESVQLMSEHVDVLQVGTRNMQNFSLLRRLAAIRKPILLKRGLASTFDEWLQAAEYLLAGGNDQVILCERGIRSFDNHSRNTLDLNVVPLVRRISHLPILVDPSHGVGDRKRVRVMARAGMAAGAHGLLVEAHTDPSTAYTDAAQTISIDTLSGILADIEVLKQLEPLPLDA